VTLLRVPVAPLAAGRLVLDEATGRYVARVHRLRPGDELVVFDPEAATEGAATVVSDRLPHVELDVSEVRATSSRPHWDVTLIQAVGKGDKPDQVVRDATVLGARRVILAHTERTVAKADGAGKRERERRIAVEAARQSGRGDLPEIVGPMSLDEAIALQDSAALRLVLCFEHGSKPLLARLGSWASKRPLAILIGPEGGLDPAEIQSAISAGFEATSLGSFTLRTETAATVALGVVQSHAELSHEGDG
jgi:16S rRNA (uracil1498-N3)-methyltransferase